MIKQLNKDSNRIFSKLLDLLGDKEYITLNAGEFMPLHLEIIGSSIYTALGKGKLYSLAHTYVQAGVLMNDPEMRFIVVDNRALPTQYEHMHIYPTMYRQDNLGIHDESILIENEAVKTFIAVWQKDHCFFANEWLKNIKAQGFLLK